MAEEWVNPNIPEFYKLEVEKCYENDEDDCKYAVDLAKLTPGRVFGDKDEQYCLPYIEILEVGEGWVRLYMRGEHTLHVGNSCSTGWYQFMPYWKGCQYVSVKYFDEK